MGEFSFQQSLQILALDAILRPDTDAFFRKVCRWYSKNFHVPLLEVSDLPTYHVLQEFYESHYEDLDAGELQRLATDICETEEEKMKRMTEDNKQIERESETVTNYAAKMQKAMLDSQAGIIKAVDALGKLRSRPSAKTVSDLQNSDSLSADLDEIMKNAKPAPQPREPDKMPGGVDPTNFEFSIGGGDIPEDYDSIGGDLSKLNLKKKPRTKL